MLKKNKNLLIVTSIVIILPLVVGLFVWDKLPDQIPIHWNVYGEIDGYGSKWLTMMGLPVFLLAIHWLCTMTTLADPKHEVITSKLWTLILWICPLISLLMGYLTIGTALGLEINVNLLLPLVLGLIFVITGNYLPKCQQNYSMGIKIPWTLNSEENWNKTHRFAGPCWIIGGIGMFICGMLGQIFVMLIMIFVVAFIPVIYSYVYYVKHEKGK